MNKIYIPKNYKPTLDAYETQRAIAYIKQSFQDEFSGALNLKRVSAPLFVTENSGLNDNLNGYERAVSFDVPAVGADAQVDGKTAVITGVNKLYAAPVKAVDLRAGAAMLIAGLVADGETVIEEIERIDRGYEDVVEKFTKLGANIKRVYYPDGVEILKQA